MKTRRRVIYIRPLSSSPNRAQIGAQQRFFSFLLFILQSESDISMSFFAILILFLFLLVEVHGGQLCGNDRGVSYADTGFSHCECFQCFSGPDCASTADPCAVEATGGNPLAYFDWWSQPEIEKRAGTMLSPDYRIGYQTQGELTPETKLPGIDPVLEKAIRDLHRTVGNAAEEDKTIVLGTGCTSLIAAATYALQKRAGKPVHVYARPPFYGGYRSWAAVNPNLTNFSQSTTLDPNLVVEFVTYPNNPTGKLRDPVYPRSPAVVHDMCGLFSGSAAPHHLPLSS
jgi:Allinase